jgi:gluconolactonase
MRPPAGIDMPNGAVNHPVDGILICAQGSSQPCTGGIWHMPRHAAAVPVVTSFHGRDFNSPNDVVVARDGCVWFTDPCYAADQEFRGRPGLPCAVYRFDPATGDLRVVADGLGRPNGIAFGPDERVVYITDTDTSHGTAQNDLQRYLPTKQQHVQHRLTDTQGSDHIRLRRRHIQ